MILDLGPCKLYDIKAYKNPGEYPVKKLINERMFYYGLLSFSSQIKYQTQNSEDNEIVKKIRILRDYSITTNTVADIDDTLYKVSKVYHGVDEDSTEEITDLSLSDIGEEYER